PLDRDGDRSVDALQRARNHGRTEVRLVVVGADRVCGRVIRGVDVAARAAAGDFEQDIRPGGDLRDAELLAIRRVLRIRVGNLEADAGVDLAGAGDKTGNVGVDTGTVIRAEDPEHVVTGAADFPSFHQAGESAHQEGRLLLFEQQVGDV